MYKHFLLLCAIGVLLAGVYSEGAKVPAPTAIIEKAPVKEISTGAFHGAIIKPSYLVQEITLGACEVPLSLIAPTNWCVDERFFETGYKALLNATVEEMIAPPDLSFV